jgi:hypothetical protein
LPKSLQFVRTRYGFLHEIALPAAAILLDRQIGR